MMMLTNSQMFWFLLAQLAFGALIVLAAAYTLRANAVRLIERGEGAPFMRMLTILLVCTITGNLALMKFLDPAAVAAIYGGVLGYVFGGADKARRTPTPGGAEGNQAEKGDR